MPVTQPRASTAVNHSMVIDPVELAIPCGRRRSGALRVRSHRERQGQGDHVAAAFAPRGTNRPRYSPATRSASSTSTPRIGGCAGLASPAGERSGPANTNTNCRPSSRADSSSASSRAALVSPRARGCAAHRPGGPAARAPACGHRRGLGSAPSVAPAIRARCSVGAPVGQVAGLEGRLGRALSQLGEQGEFLQNVQGALRVDP